MSESDGLIERRKLSHEVLDRLKARIASGEFAPGAPLPSERALMAAYGVGRPAIREALQTLERDGLVSIAHGARARVTLPSASDILGTLGTSVSFLLKLRPDALDQLKGARLMLETAMARSAAERATEAGLLDLRRALEAHRTAPLAEFLSRDIAFHVSVARLTGNAIFPLIVEAVLSWLGDYHRGMVRAQGAEALTLAEHAHIVEAIAARDPAAAERAMADHLNRVNALYRQLA